MGASNEKKAAAAPPWLLRVLAMTAISVAAPLPSGVTQFTELDDDQNEVAQRVLPIMTETVRSIWPKFMPEKVIDVPDDVGALKRATCVITGASYE